MVKSLIKDIMEMADDFVSFIWPSTCASCNERLFKHEDTICTNCLIKLPRTHFHLWKENDFHRLFWGKVNIEYATAFFFFLKESKYRKLIHKLKYQHMPEIGVILGRELGYEIAQSVFSEIDLIVPVPLHPKKEFIRGYNQSDKIAIGLGQGMGKPIDCKTLIRNTHTASQTRKNRYERWENVNSIFTVTNHEIFRNKHILIVDDVVTTGSTLESCIVEVLNAGAAKVSLAALGIAKE